MMVAIPVSLGQVQAIQGASGVPVPVGVSCAKAPKGSKPVRLWYSGNCSYGPSARSVAAGFESGCPGQIPLVSSTVECPPPSAPSDDDQVNTVSRGIQRGLKNAPLLVVDEAPWISPSYRGIRYPINDVIVAGTFAATDARTIWAQNALASYLGTTAYPIPAVQLTAGNTTPVLSFQPSSSWTGDELVVACCDQEVLYLVQWSVAINGRSVCGPFALIGGRFPINVQARRSDNVSVFMTLVTGDAFAVGLEILVNGWVHPALSQTDGTYSKILRSSPSWPRSET